ncbi:MAG: transketolase [Ilumatobacter sp.]
MPLTTEQDSHAVSLIRGFSMDGPLAANSGHQGTGMALAPLAHALYSRVMKHDPADPHWHDRDRFVLSVGHVSIMQYAMLFLSGYGLELDDIKNFRQWDSKTPGHPEVGHTAGVEVTTGPLGQGFANAVGLAIAEANQRARFGSDAVDHHTFVVVGDGCMMEGISHEAADLAGHLGLDHLVCIFDDNSITIDGRTDITTSVDMAARMRAYGWDVVELGDIANDVDALEAALNAAKATEQPSFLMLKTKVGFPSPDFTDDHSAHGNPFKAEHVTSTKAVMGIPDEPFWAPDALVASYRSTVAEQATAARAGRSEPSSPEWVAAAGATGLSGWDSDLPSYEHGDSVATRKAIQKALDATDPHLPGLMSGSADLKGSNGVALGASHPFSSTAPDGRYVHYGIREHAMGAVAVGLALHGGVIPVTATFFVFADYMRPAIRLAALSGAKVCFVFTHDSVGVGEDGPTHQPVEQLASLRVIPNLHVIRPADGNETIQAWADVVRHDGPSALVLSRQDITVTTDGSAVAKGADVIAAVESPKVVLVGTGSEVSLCVEAADVLAGNGIATQVVSMPSWDRFDEQDAAHHASVFPDGVPVLSVEAGVSMGWSKYADASVAIDRFGASAPGGLVLDKLGMNVENVVHHATALVN